MVVTSSRVWRTDANRDDTYYAEGVVNPNTAHNAMYWKEPSNVLQDLDQFDKLYVQYHECAWSEILQQNNNGGGDESDTWYLKSVPRVGAQVAYSLHGVLKGHRDRGCSKATYILSAHTSSGITGFTNVLANLGVEGFTAVQNNGGEGDHQENNNGNGQVTSNCQSQEGQQQHRFLNEGQQQQGDNQKYYYEYNADQTSVGAICQNKRFVQAQISGSSCSGTVQEVVDELTDFNALLSNQAKCVQIYARGDSYSQQQDGQQQQQQEGGDGSPLALLQNSYSCWYQQPDCPDPYGKQRKYQQAVERATSSNLSVQDQETKARAATYLLFSVAFLVGAVYLLVSPGRGGSIPPGYVERIKSRRRASRKNKMLQSKENGSQSNRSEWTGPDISQTMSQEVSLASESQPGYSYDEQSQRVALSTDTSNDDSSAYPRPPPTHLWQDDQQEAMNRRKGFLSKFRAKKGEKM